jgi:beta-glucosidase
MITGHGISTEDEGLRVRLLKEHLQECHQAIAAGVDLRGYFYWSLLDNFDWSEGLSQKFGLVAVCFEDPERRRDIRRTGCVYGEIARHNGFTPL